MSSSDMTEPAGRPSVTDVGDFLSWYHHALAVAYSVSAAVSDESMPFDRLALYSSLCQSLHT